MGENVVVILAPSLFFYLISFLHVMTTVTTELAAIDV